MDKLNEQQTEAFWREAVARDIEKFAKDFHENSLHKFLVNLCASIARGHTKP
jgi:hypothetical protein